ncbi:MULTISPECIES: sigma factor [unclassified Kitasatospora]|uniref:sigma factor n=1 Tax=unclassified Kitasatospora TaxID=2633591 RepID=UPI0024760B96|nr:MULTISPECIES: sigma factor [unclassified Kitasatospora]MDH6123833.1 DNA-directed RNA polymerase specialized sigma subunit [Kitasatospora sp. GP82]MDH6576068.1 DNA-directed RNA polymerase specialized sigma subunit [Kitasatospora sp. MAP5-34]
MVAYRNIADLPFETIVAAKASDLDAVSEVIAATEFHISFRAGQHATINGRYDAELAEDLAQVGRVAVWTNLANFEGTTSVEFSGYMDRHIDRAMARERRQETAVGVSHEIARRFEDALTKAGGDQFEAERIAADKTISGKYAMTPQTAYAARLAWRGSVSLDAPVGEDGSSLGDLIASEMGIPGDMVTSRDVENYKRAETKKAVHATLDKLSDRMAGVLKRDYGFSGVQSYGDVIGADDADMAADMGLTPYQVQQARTKGKDRFRNLYVVGAFGDMGTA